MKQEKSVFVSRHGRKTTIDEDLETLHIEDAPVAEVALPVRQQRAKLKVWKPSLPSKRGLIVIGSVVALVIFLPLLVFELITAQYSSSAYALTASVRETGASIALPSQKADKARAGIDASLKQLSKKKDNACRGGLLDNVAGLYPRAKQALQRCNDAREKVASIVAGLTTLQSTDEYMTKVNDILKTPLAANTGEYAVIPDQVESWKAAQTKLKALNPPTQLAAFHATLVQNVSTLATAWSELNVANNQQDSLAFRDAEAKLTASYDTFRASAGELSARMQEAQAEVNSSYKAI